MKIKFTCPNGHQLAAERNRIGKPGKCPKCGTKFVVPKSSDDGEQQPKAKEPTFAFLCPNGHELHGPVSLRGRPGQCPHCDEKFLIPEEDEGDDSDVPAEAAPADAVELLAPPEVFPAEKAAEKEEVPVGIVEVPPEAVLLEDEDIPTGELEVSDLSIEEELTLDDDFNPPQVQPSGAARKSSGVMTKPEHQSLLELIAWMWDHRSSDSHLEIAMQDGEVVRAVRYSPTLSDGEYGVFAAKGDDDSYTICTVAWDAVTRVALRNVRELPESYFK